MIDNIYIYKALVTGVYDGDSITCLVDVGFKISFMIKVRLANINTPELRGDERESGLIARDVLREKILDKEIIISTFKDKKGKYGRYIGIIYLEEPIIDDSLINEGVKGTTQLININEWLVENNYAEYKEY